MIQQTKSLERQAERLEEDVRRAQEQYDRMDQILMSLTHDHQRDNIITRIKQDEPYESIAQLLSQQTTRSRSDSLSSDSEMTITDTDMEDQQPLPQYWHIAEEDESSSSERGASPTSTSANRVAREPTHKSSNQRWNCMEISAVLTVDC